VPGRGGGDTELESNDSARVGDGEVADRVCAEHGLIGGIYHRGFTDVRKIGVKIGVNLDEELAPCEPSGITQPARRWPLANRQRAEGLPNRVRTRTWAGLRGFLGATYLRRDWPCRVLKLM
jgi:hypothetical protein